MTWSDSNPVLPTWYYTCLSVVCLSSEPVISSKVASIHSLFSFRLQQSCLVLYDPGLCSILLWPRFWSPKEACACFLLILIDWYFSIISWCCPVASYCPVKQLQDPLIFSLTTTSPSLLLDHPSTILLRYGIYLSCKFFVVELLVL